MLAVITISRPLMRNGPAQVVEQPQGEADRADLVAAVVDQHRELVAAEPGRHRVGREDLAEPLGHADEQLVADRVAEAVVDGLEVVEVDEQHAGRPPVPRIDRLVDQLGEHRAVGEAGERVVERLVAEVVLELLADGDVTGVEHDALRRPARRAGR